MRRTPKLGQHFLSGLWAAAKLVEAANVGANDVVLEIGPGHGALTREIVKTGARVLAIEKDEMLAHELQETFREEIAHGRLHIVTGDVRDFDATRFEELQNGYVLAANIPYYITGEILRQFLSATAHPMRLALLIQKEVAERIVARDEKESILSLSVKAYGTPRIAAKVSRGNFSPPPSVDSAIMIVDSVSKRFFEDLDEDSFFRVVRAGFSSKRKKLSSNLSVFGKELAREALTENGLGENVRAEDVPLEKWRSIALYLRQHTGHQ